MMVPVEQLLAFATTVKKSVVPADMLDLRVQVIVPLVLTGGADRPGAGPGGKREQQRRRQADPGMGRARARPKPESAHAARSAIPKPLHAFPLAGGSPALARLRWCVSGAWRLASRVSRLAS